MDQQDNQNLGFHVLKVPWSIGLSASATWVQGFFFHFFNIFARTLKKVALKPFSGSFPGITQGSWHYPESKFRVPGTITTPYSSTSSQRGNRYYQNDVIPLQNLFFDFPLLKLGEYRQTKKSEFHKALLKFASYLLWEPTHLGPDHVQVNCRPISELWNSVSINFLQQKFNGSLARVA